MDIPGYTPIYIPGGLKYTRRQIREWDELVKCIVQTDGNIAEIGCNQGINTRLFALNFPHRTVYAVDYYAETRTMPQEQLDLQNHYKTFVNSPENIAEKVRHLSNVVAINANSQTYDWDQFKNVTFFFIDADHSYKGVKSDVENAIRYLKKNKGGYISCHDYRSDNKYPWIEVFQYITAEIAPKYKLQRARKTYLVSFKVDKA